MRVRYKLNKNLNSSSRANEQSMNVVILAYEYPPILGGAQIQAKRLAFQLSKSGHKATILTSRIGLARSYTMHNKIAQVEIFRIPSWGFQILSKIFYARARTCVG